MNKEKKVSHKARKVRPVRVVFDNNVIFSCRRLAGPNIDLLEMFIKRTGSTFVLPRIILEEACKKYSEDLTKKVDDVQGAVERLNGFLARDSGAIPAKLNVPDEVKTYHDLLVKKVASLGGEIVEYEDMPLKSIAQRALSERRPFRPDDKGCRDAILWETILRKIARKKQQTILITHDGGFGDQNQLHQDLMDDLTEAGFPETAVVLFTDLENFLGVFAKPLPPVYMKGVLAKLRKGRYPGFSAVAFVGKHRHDIIEASKPYGDDIIRNAGFNRVLAAFEEPVEIACSDFEERQVEVVDAVELDENRVFLTVAFPCTVTLDGFITKPEYYCLDDRDRDDICVLDNDWNESYMWAQTNTDAVTRLALTLNVKSDKVEKWEISDIDRTAIGE